jgi:hypothetical protein
VSWKLSRTVLRGGTDGNIGPLLGKTSGKVRQPYLFEVGEGSCLPRLNRLPPATSRHDSPGVDRRNRRRCPISLA